MAGHTLLAAVHHVRRVAGLGASAESDADLLRRFLIGDAVAFERLVGRHGPMVLGIGRRLLRDVHAAEDAFQVTFLALARRADSIARRGSVGPWLCRVAFRAALRVRAAAPATEPLEHFDPPDDGVADPAAAAAIRELQTAVAEELAALPDRYRTALGLHHLGGRTCDQVAAELGCRRGTIAARLSRGRILLRRRLLRRGIAAPAAGAAVLLAGRAAAIVPRESTRQAAACAADWAGGRAIPARVLSLTEGVLRAMTMAKLKLTGLWVAMGIAASGVATWPAAAFLPGAAAQAPASIDRVPVDQPPRPADPLEARLRRIEDRLSRLEAHAGATGDGRAAPPGPIEAVPGLQTERRTGLPSFARGAQPGSTAAGPAAALAILAARLKYKVPFELGRTQSADGGRLEILEVWGTQPQVKVGGQYVVHGKYRLPSQEDGMLYLRFTADRAENGTSAELDLQYTSVSRGEGEFTLMHGLWAPGWFHLTLVGKAGDRGVTFVDQYFGTGDTVYRKQ